MKAEHARPDRALPAGPARRTVALCLVGLSPAVVTETLHALAVERRPPVVPDELHLITTRTGATLATARLLGRDGALAHLRAEYRLAPGVFRCPPGNLHVLAGARGEPLEDIVTTADSEAVGEQIGARLRALKAAPGVELHCSLAGGRKTMGALLAAAFQLHAGPRDRLYHVLVSPPFDQVPDFYFPTRRRLQLDWKGGIVDARHARVTLAEIPVPRLGQAVRRLGLSELNLTRQAAEIEAEANDSLGLDPLVLDPAGGRARVGARELPLPPREMALYLFYARARRACRRRACREGERCPGCQLSDGEVHDRRAGLLALLRPGVAKQLRKQWDAGDRDALEDFHDWLRELRSRLNSRLRSWLGPGRRGYLVTEMSGAGDSRRRGLGLASRLVRIERPRR